MKPSVLFPSPGVGHGNVPYRTPKVVTLIGHLWEFSCIPKENTWTPLHQHKRYQFEKWDVTPTKKRGASEKEKQHLGAFQPYAPRTGRVSPLSTEPPWSSASHRPRSGTSDTRGVRSHRRVSGPDFGAAWRGSRNG